MDVNICFFFVSKMTSCGNDAPESAYGWTWFVSVCVFVFVSLCVCAPLVLGYWKILQDSEYAYKSVQIYKTCIKYTVPSWRSSADQVLMRCSGFQLPRIYYTHDTISRRFKDGRAACLQCSLWIFVVLSMLKGRVKIFWVFFHHRWTWFSDMYIIYDICIWYDIYIYISLYIYIHIIYTCMIYTYIIYT